MNAREIGPGLWHWTAPHPAWRSGADWPEDVGCVYYEAPDSVVLIDPLVPLGEEDTFWLALDRDVERAGLPVQVLLTAPWHQRSAVDVSSRYGADVWAHPSGHVRLSLDAQAGELPAGVELFVPEGPDDGQVAFFLRSHRALVVAEFFMGIDGGLRVCPPPVPHDPQAFRDSLHRLLELPIERVLVAHGEPVLEDGLLRIEEALA
jgi:glyoxylase-like metal-dependent hydrolase (beta-lactamase superfamily II)